MAIVKSNICKQCGGLLDIDIDRQVYICPFCGVTFDYEYFRKDNVLDLAKRGGFYDAIVEPLFAPGGPFEL